MLFERDITFSDVVPQLEINKFYYDGNKRTSRLVCNYILLSNGQGVLNVKAKDRLEFNTLMLEFYNARKADNIVEFFYKKCLERYI
ncbi:hypothetical protein [Clostridium diolis]|uniref:Fido domain-containing protein n=1 Tax=Clostridium diolis TaxID=223919 RepID=A0AAV3VUV9_9CLOT|nr:hypothetical protein [Clostridium diolis]GEA30028.1 hypothetical protein CDIOL_09510 [Clostridium diolis]